MGLWVPQCAQAGEVRAKVCTHCPAHRRSYYASNAIELLTFKRVPGKGQEHLLQTRGKSAGTSYGRLHLQLPFPTPTASCRHHLGHHQCPSSDSRSVPLSLKPQPLPRFPEISAALGCASGASAIGLCSHRWPGPSLSAPRSRDPLAGAGCRRTPCALTATSSRPGARRSLLGESLEAATRKRACDSGARAGVGAEIRCPAPAAVLPPFLPPLPGPPRPSAPPEGGSAINKRGSVARGRRSCCASRQIAGSGRRVSRHREPPGRAGELPGQAPAASAPLPLHGSAAAASCAALQSGGASRQRVQTPGQGLNSTAASSLATLHPLRKAEAGETRRKEERAEASGKPELWSPQDSPARRRLRPGRRQAERGAVPPD
nr:uncharacterized protein LOC116152715 [Camelus dromedarius]